MKLNIFTSLLFMLVTVFSFAQFTTKTCVLFKNKDDFSVVDHHGDSTLVSKVKWNKYNIENQGVFEIANGKGLKKDTDGIREWNKKYLVKNEMDTLLTLHKHEDRLIMNDEISLHIEETDDGWKFLNEQNEVVYELELLWNHKKYVFTIQEHESSPEMKHLNQFILTSLPHLAEKRSTSEDEVFDILFIMWLTML